MYDIAKNKNGEDLYLLVDVKTNSIKPYTYINTWVKVMEKFEALTEENDDTNYFAQIVHKIISKTGAEASMRCNKRGWGYDYFRYITVEPLYIND